MCGGKYQKGKEEEADVWMRRKKKKNIRKKKEKKNWFWVGLHDRWRTCTKLLFSKINAKLMCIN